MYIVRVGIHSLQMPFPFCVLIDIIYQFHDNYRNVCIYFTKLESISSTGVQ
jgi:hypothetical protein